MKIEIKHVKSKDGRWLFRSVAAWIDAVNAGRHVFKCLCHRLGKCSLEGDGNGAQYAIQCLNSVTSLLQALWSFCLRLDPVGWGFEKVL